MADSNPQASGGEEGSNSWEKPWSIEEMRKSANDWSLAGDAGMLRYLQDFSQRIISRTHDMQEQMNGLLHESKLAEVRVQNAFNDFIMLANTQFVENRVYDEDVNSGGDEVAEKKEEKNKSREEREAELIPKITTAMQLGLSVIDTAFDQLDVNEGNSDSEEDDDSPYKTETTILEPKDPYITRPLPYIIGSQAFMTDDDVGLRDIPSDTGEDDGGISTESESESESEPEPELKQKPPRKESVSDSEEYESDSESETDIFGGKDSDEESDESSESGELEQKPDVQPSDFAAELASKMGGAPHPETVKKEKKSHESKKERSSSKSKPKPAPEPNEDDDLFGPPPMEDEDSPFGKKGGLFSTGGGLFDDEEESGGGLFDDIIAEKPKPAKEQKLPQAPPKSESESESESEEDMKPQEPPSRAKTRSGKPVPAGGVSIFSGGDDLLFGPPKEDSDREKPKSKPKEIKKPAAPASAAKGLFDDDDEDLFAAPVKKEPPQKKSASKPAVSLFDEDEEEDLFAAPPPKQEVKQEPPKPEKKLPAGAVSMFGNNSNPLADAIKAQLQQPPDEESDDEWDEEEEESEDEEEDYTSSQPPTTHIKPAPAALTALTSAKKERSPSVSSNSLFAEEPEDDLFASKPKTSLPAKTTSTPKTRGAGSAKLFGDDDDEYLFSTSNKPKQSQSESKRPKAGSLFLDEEDDEGNLFGTAVPKPTKKAESSNKKLPEGVPLLSEDPFGEVTTKKQEKEVSKPKKEEKVEPSKPRKNTLSLFDDDNDDDEDEGVFGSSKPKSPVKPPATLETQHPTKKARTPSLFADDDVLFGGAEEDPSVDLFDANSPLSPSEESKPFLPKAEITKEPKSRPANLKDKVEVKGATLSASSTDLLSGEDNAMLFKTEGIDHTTIQKADPKLHVKGATTSESSTDKSAKPPDIVKKKPVGGVPMFGGFDPKAVLKKQTPPKEPPKEDVQQAEADNSPSLGLDSTDLTPSTKPQNDLPPQSASLPRAGGPPRSTSIGKLQANLGINPSALLPGAAPRVKEAAPAPVGFDEPTQHSTLHTVQKDRVRVQAKRRPPTRKPRLATSPNESDLSRDTPDFNPGPVTNGPVDISPPKAGRVQPAPSSTQKGIFDEDERDDLHFPTKVRPEPTVSGVKAPLRSKPELVDDLFPDPGSSAANVPKSTSDIFSEAFSKYSASKKEKPPKSSTDDIFSKAMPPPKKPQEQKVIVDITEDLFGDTMETSSSTNSKVKGSRGTGDMEGDIFSSASKQASSSRPILHAPSRSPPPLDDSPDDIFSDSSLLNKKTSSLTPPDDDEDIFASSSLKSSTLPVPENDDIFASTTTSLPESSSKEAVADVVDSDDLFAVKPPSGSKKRAKAATKDEALFEDNTDIFSDLPAQKAKEKKPKKKPSSNDKSLFKDDIDDIFAETGVKSKPKKAGSKKNSSKGDIFGDSQKGDNIFDDPLNALTH